MISVDDHLVEPRHLFEGRLPAALADRAPVREDDVEGPRDLGVRRPGLPAGRVSTPWSVAARTTRPWSRCASTRCGGAAGIPTARVADMDLAGIWASVNFPSQITGFCGTVYSQCSDPALGQACVRAFNDWFLEEWWSAASRSLRAHGHHLPGRSRAGRGRDPSQRGAGLPRREPARAAPPPGLPVAALGLVGSGAGRLRRDRHGRSACTWAARG